MNSKIREAFRLIKQTFDEKLEIQEKKNQELNETFIKTKCLMEEYNETLVFFRDTLLNFNKEIETIKHILADHNINKIDNIDENDSDANNINENESEADNIDDNESDADNIDDNESEVESIDENESEADNIDN